MRKILPAVVILGVMVLVIVLLTTNRSAQKPPPGGAADDGTLIIISPNSKPIQDEFGRVFEAWHQAAFNAPCKIEWRDHGGTSGDVRYINSEFARRPEGIGVDLLWGGGMEPYLQFSERNLLQPVTLSPELMATLQPTIGGVPVCDPARLWYGTALSSFGIIYNRKRLAEAGLAEPKTWEDLAAPEYFGLVGVAEPRESGTALMMVEIVLQAYGWEKGCAVLARTAANAKQVTRGASDVPKKVGLGEFAAGGAIDFYAWTQIEKDGPEKIGFVLPVDLTPVTPDCIGMLKGAPHPQAARRFIEFVLSEEGQRLWVLPKGAPGGPVSEDLLRIPVVPSIYAKYAAQTKVAVDPAQLKTSFAYDPQKAAARRDALKDMYGVMYVDTGTELRAAWRAVIARGLKPEEVQRLCAPPVTEAELTELAATQWKDAAQRNATLNKWTAQAMDTYKSLAR